MKRSKTFRTITVTFAAFNRTSSGNVRFTNVKHARIDFLKAQKNLNQSAEDELHDQVNLTLIKFLQGFEE